MFEFKDYTESELATIFKQIIDEKATRNNGRTPWRLDRAGLSQVVGRRLASRAGVPGFGNAGDVRNMVETILDRQRDRVRNDPSAEPYLIIVEDVLGNRPDLSTCRAYKKIQSLIGLQSIKDSAAQLIDKLQVRWDADRDCAPLAELPMLSRVFVGNPGTGKTSVALIYAELLKETGFLSEGSLILKKPADFIGVKTGETLKFSRAIMESAKGNVLVIDEAYGLMKSPEAIDTIVAAAPAQGGADMAIIMCGYKDEMDELLEKTNPGLARRFPGYWVFESYNEQQLRQIMTKKSRDKCVDVPFAVADASARHLARESMLRNFGNAGAVDSFLEKLKSAAEARVRTAKKKQMEAKAKSSKRKRSKMVSQGQSEGSEPESSDLDLDPRKITMDDFKSVTEEKDAGDELPLNKELAVRTHIHTQHICNAYARQ